MSLLIQKEALYPQLVWDQPQHKDQYPKILILGGSANDLKAPLAAYQICQELKLKCLVALPDSLKKLTGKQPELVFCPTSSTGSLSRESLGAIEEVWSKTKGLVLAGSFSRNQETKQLLEGLVQLATSPLVAVGDALDLLEPSDQVSIVIDPGRLKRLISVMGQNYSTQLPIPGYADLLAKLPHTNPWISWHNNQLWLKVESEVCATPFKAQPDQKTCLQIACWASLYLAKTGGSVFARLATALWQVSKTQSVA